MFSQKVRSAAAVLLQPTAHGKGERYGYSVAAAGDIDGDGRMDFHAGAPWFQSERGYVRTMSGAIISRTNSADRHPVRCPQLA